MADRQLSEKPSVFGRLGSASVVTTSAAAAAGTCLMDVKWQAGIPVLSLAVFLGVAGLQTLLVCMVALAGVNLGFLTGYDPSLFAAGGGTSFEGLRLLIVLGAFALVVARDPEVVGDLRPVVPYLVFVSFAAFSLLWSPARAHGIRDLIKLGYPLVAFFLAMVAIRSGRRVVIERLILISALIGSISHVLIRLAGASVYEHFEGRYYGGWHPNLMGMFCVGTGLPLLVWGISRKSVGWLTVSCLMLVQLVLTGSRTMFLAGAVGAAVALVLLRRHAIFVAAGTLAVIGWLTVPTLGERSQVISMADAGLIAGAPLQNLSGRLLLWADVWTSLVPGHELAGNGLGASAAYLQGRYLVGKHVHNEYLETLADLGLLGLLLLLVWLGAMSFRVWSRMRNATRTPIHQITFFSMLSAFVVASVMENTLAPAAEYTLFLWLCFALALGTDSENER